MMIDSEDTKEEGLDYLTIGEAARYLGLGRKMIYQLIELDRIRARRRRQVLMVDRQSLEDFRGSGGLA
jgi:excisionase family DNA binding protein